MSGIGRTNDIRLLWKVEPWSTASQRLLITADTAGMAADDETAVLYMLLDGDRKSTRLNSSHRL